MRQRYFGDKRYDVEELEELLLLHAGRVMQQTLNLVTRLRSSGLKTIPGRTMREYRALCLWNREYGLRTANRWWALLREHIRREEQTLREIESGLRQPWAGIPKVAKKTKKG